MTNTAPPTPWTELDEEGTNLTVDVFLTTLMSQVGNALRRMLTVPYAEQFGLTVPEWRVLSLVAHAGRIAFGELVIQSTSDKALVSRTLRLLESRDLVHLESESDKPRTKLWCAITPQGELLHRQVIPIARARQAVAIRTLPPAERDAMYRALVRLRDYCRQDEKRSDQASDPNENGL
ncbi:MAG: winged helix-turn-helix transcriptional regulator [Proteobacteria bacterium]|nr:winged helix-turn-helix transcriptional regulator [Pseudomonadota bacterium]